MDKNSTLIFVDFLSANDAPRRPQNVTDMGQGGNFLGISQTDFWKTHPGFDQRWMSFSEISLTHDPKIEVCPRKFWMSFPVNKG